MLELFRKNHFLNSILLLFYTFIVRIFSLIANPVWEGEAYGIISFRILEALDSSAVLQNILAILLLFFQAALINRLYITNRMPDVNTLFPGMFYILLCSLFPEFLYLSPILIGNTFFIVSITSVLYSYKKIELSGFLFNGGFWLALASVFYFPFIYFLPFLFVSVAILRILKLKDILQVLSGVVAVYFLVFSMSYLSDNVNLFFQTQFLDNFTIFDFHKKPSITEWIILIFYGLLIIWSILNYSKFELKKGIQAQKKINILYWALFVCIFSILFQKNVEISHLIIINIPLAFFLGESFNFIKKRGIAEAFHLFLFFGALILHYLSFY